MPYTGGPLWRIATEMSAALDADTVFWDFVNAQLTNGSQQGAARCCRRVFPNLARCQRVSENVGPSGGRPYDNPAHKTCRDDDRPHLLVPCFFSSPVHRERSGSSTYAPVLGCA